MAKAKVYEVTIPNFFKHNPKSKKGYTHFMISKHFFNDDKIASCTPSMVMLYLFLVNLCADYSSSTVKLSETSVPPPIKLGLGLGKLLARLEELQLVTVAKNDFLLNRIEENRIESKRIEGAHGEKQNQKRTNPKSEPSSENAIQATLIESPPKTNRVIARYCELWKLRYDADAPISGRVAGQLKTFVKDHGETKALSFIEAYLEMPDAWFVTKRHDIPTMIANLNAIAQYMATGKIFSRKEITNLDQAVSTKNLLDMIESGEI